MSNAQRPRPTLPAAVTKRLVERPVLDREGPVAEITTAIATVDARYRVDVDAETLQTTNVTLAEVVVRLKRTGAVDGNDPETLEIRLTPAEFEQLAAAYAAAEEALLPAATFTAPTTDTPEA